MKTFNALVLAAVSTHAEERGMTPPKRLEKLQNNFKSWLTENLDSPNVHPNLINKWNGHVDKIVSNMLRAYSRPVCGFFDSSIKHGGPDPNTHQRPDGKERRPIDRKRRQTDDDSSDGTDLLKYDKNNPIKGLNQILGNFRTWAERHINECWGQRKHNHVSNRMQRWIRNALLII